MALKKENYLKAGFGIITSSIVLLAIISLESCKKDPKKDPSATSKDVYVAGFESNGSKMIAKVWKNGVATSLTDGTEDAVANDIFVVDTNVYVSGYIYSGTNIIAALWKNNVLTKLSAPSENASASAVFVSGSDVYVSGGTNTAGIIWKNGVATRVECFLNSIFVSGTTIYVCGSIHSGGTTVVKSWRNNVPVTLTSTTNIAGATSISVYESDAYVAGFEEKWDTTVTASGVIKRELIVNPRVWKNGVEVVLPKVPRYSMVNAICATKTGFYAVGEESDSTDTRYIGKSWTESTTTYLKTEGSNFSSGQGVTMSGADLYVAGYEIVSKVYIAKIWKNGVSSVLTDGTHAAQALSIFVK